MFDNVSEKAALREHLKAGVVTVKFKKKDGTVRDMKCTLKEDLVVSYDKKSEKKKTISEDVCSVFDLDKNEWRSFRYDSVISMRFN